MAEELTFLTEAECQVLVVLIELSQPIETENNNFYRFYPQSVEEAATYFRGFREDWVEAYSSLQAKGLVERARDNWSLTLKGVQLASQVRRARPPIFYWYKDYYALTARSQVYARYCEMLYGKNLCQANFSDMEQLGKLLDVLQLKPGDQVLDLGCGSGKITEYLSETSAAHFTGVDYCTEAVEQALERTCDLRHRLDFAVQNFDALDFPESSLDAVISIDTLYMPNDLDDTLRKIVSFLKPGGKLAVFYTHMVWGEHVDRKTLEADHTPLGEAFHRLGLAFTTWDFSEQTYYHLKRKRKIGEQLRPDFEAEGTLALYQSIINESDADPSPTPYDPEKCNFARYLYDVVVEPAPAHASFLMAENREDIESSRD